MSTAFCNIILILNQQKKQTKYYKPYIFSDKLNYFLNKFK